MGVLCKPFNFTLCVAAFISIAFQCLQRHLALWYIHIHNIEHSLVPRLPPAFRRLQHGKTGRKKSGSLGTRLYRTHAHTCTHTHAHTHSHTHTYMYKHTHIHTHTHTCINTHTFTHTHTGPRENISLHCSVVLQKCREKRRNHFWFQGRMISV